MERSLSILLPVHNAQATLRRSAIKVLDLAAELTSKFELLLIDNGSTDHTVEVAYDLSVYYPQIHVARLTRRSGLAEAVRIGLERTQGEIICIHEGLGAVDVADIRRLWQLRNQEDLVLARHSSRSSLPQEGWIERLLGTGRPHAPATGGSGFHMLRRSALEALQCSESLAATQHEVRLRPDAQPNVVPQPAAAPTAQPTPVSPQSLRRPNFMTRLRQMTSGE